MHTFLRLLEHYGYVSPMCKEVLKKEVQLLAISKGEILLNSGELPQFVYFLESGLVRGYYEFQNKTVDIWYATDLTLLYSTYPLYKRKASFVNIQCLEDCVVYALPHQVLLQLLTNFPEFNTVLRRAAEEYALQLEERNLELATMTPRDRFDLLCRKLNQHIHRIPVQHIASYLRVSVDLVQQMMAK